MPVVQAVGRHSLPRVSERPSSNVSCVSGGMDSARNPPARSPAAKSGPPIGCMSGTHSVRCLNSSMRRKRLGHAEGRLLARRPGADHVEERLDPRQVAGVAAVLVELQGEERLLAHDFLDEAQEETVRPAGEVREVDPVEVRVVADELGRGEDVLAVGPVHVLEIGVELLHVVREHVHRDDGEAEVGDLLRQREVRARVERAVGAADDDDGGLAGRLDFAEQPKALFAAETVEFVLRRVRLAPGAADLRARDAERAGAGPSRSRPPAAPARAKNPPPASAAARHPRRAPSAPSAPRSGTPGRTGRSSCSSSAG